MTGADGRDEPVGVLGGLGPAATVHFMQRVLELTDAVRDQDHVDLLVWQHGSIPDRTAFLLGEGESPEPALVAEASGHPAEVVLPGELEVAGAPQLVPVQVLDVARHLDQRGGATVRSQGLEHPGGQRRP